MSHTRSIARRHPMRSALLALGLAAVAVTAEAQTTIASPPAAPAAASTPPASSPDPLDAVTVEGLPRDPLRNMDPKKRAQFDKEAGKSKALKDYRASRPPTPADSKGISDPNDLSVDYPGLSTYVPKN